MPKDTIEKANQLLLDIANFYIKERLERDMQREEIKQDIEDILKRGRG
jgi:hypothetical protein